MTPDLQAIGKQFRLEGALVGGRPYGSGHVNDTYLTRWNGNGTDKIWIIQRINHTIFKDPAKVMDNIAGISAHIHRKLESAGVPDLGRRVLSYRQAQDGRTFFRDRDGNYWRTCNFIDGASSHDICAGPGQAYEAARALGEFQMLLSDYPSTTLHETIPFFHHTPHRLAALEKAIAMDSHNRRATAGTEIEFALARKAHAGTVCNMLEAGTLPTRVTHNDTKLNNVMIDDKTGHGICVIDLDTVMPGSILYDVGDMVRTATITSAEDEQDTSRVDIDMGRFEAIIHGYLDGAAGLPTLTEKRLLAFCGRLITYTVGVRFLTDHLSGDVYFKTHRPNHNIERARAQFRMVQKMEERSAEMERIVLSYCG
ncbi:MAG: aminoglycoside phosphotransferase family protein [bacterium]